MSGLSEDEITQNLVSTFLQEMLSGDVDAGNSLAQLYLGELPNNKIYLHLAIVEALILQSAQLGSSESSDFLNNVWPETKEVFTGRLRRQGMV